MPSGLFGPQSCFLTRARGFERGTAGARGLAGRARHAAGRPALAGQPEVLPAAAAACRDSELAADRADGPAAVAGG